MYSTHISFYISLAVGGGRFCLLAASTRGTCVILSSSDVPIVMSLSTRSQYYLEHLLSGCLVVTRCRSNMGVVRSEQHRHVGLCNLGNRKPYYA